MTPWMMMMTKKRSMSWRNGWENNRLPQQLFHLLVRSRMARGGALIVGGPHANAI